MKKLISWQTWKKRNPTLQHFVVRDGVKGWVRDVVCATLQHYNYHPLGQRYDYGLCENIKPKALAIQIIEDMEKVWGKGFFNDKELVYYYSPYAGNNGFMDNLYVFYR